MNRAALATLPPAHAAVVADLAARAGDLADDLTGEGWLLLAANPAATPAALRSHLVAYQYNSRRAGGKRGPGACARLDDGIGDLLVDQQDPLTLLLAAEAVRERWRASDLGDCHDTAELAQQLGVTRRRAQQLVAAQVAAAAVQGDLFGGEVA